MPLPVLGRNAERGSGSRGGTLSAPPPSSLSATVNASSRPADPDALLVRQHLSGDAKAFEQLFRRYQTPIFNLVTRMVRGEDAYDLTQDVFLKALRSLKSFRGEAKFSTWLFTIARHTCLNYIRHKAVISEDSIEGQQEEHPGGGTELMDQDMDVARLCETRELQRIVDGVLATMPPEARLLLILRDFEQLSYDEISQVTELSIVNVKSKIHRARLAFKKRFQPYLELLEGGVG
ncbi:MAG: sigma-70 family RNA polymerase sigma factor [Cytophagales bacterium]|nr:sigma-70 family RNA polymerase sigma factor [Armatimonadota bacterium]